MHPEAKYHISQMQIFVKERKEGKEGEVEVKLWQYFNKIILEKKRLAGILLSRDLAALSITARLWLVVCLAGL